ncbi:hypothetical protein [Kitasatospora sp. NPDC059673]|uniref:hypothetical protein n=1 Tax=Kitasatospora sp. NPDC059673 TaxID=3346901 RepID=UPI0036BB2878
MPSARPTDQLFIDYMHAFKAAVEHMGDCLDCENDLPCETGTSTWTRFVELQQQWESRSSTALTT